MRLHIEMDDDLVALIDREAGPRGRSDFIRSAVKAALDRRARTALVRSARGALSDSGHEWDGDPGEWVRRQRRGDRKRVG